MDIKQLQNELEKLNLERNNLADKLEDLADREQELLDIVKNEKNSVKKMEGTIDVLQEMLYELYNLLEKHEDERLKVTESKKSVNKKLNELDKQLTRKNKQIEQILNDELCKKSLTVNEKNAYFVLLQRNTGTTPIITKYCKSDKEFMVLDADMRLPTYNSFSYIIVKSNKTIVGTQENTPTMSELKSVAGRSISGVSIPRMQYLKKHIIDAVDKYK